MNVKNTQQILTIEFIGKIIDININNQIIIANFPQYYEKKPIAFNLKDYKEITFNIDEIDIDDYVIYAYLIPLNDKLDISTYFRTLPRKIMTEPIQCKLYKPTSSEESLKKQYKEATKMTTQFTVFTLYNEDN
jgi:hypothetical protein